MLIFLKPPLGKRIDGWESGSSGFQLLLSKSPTNVQPYRWRNLLQAIHHLQFRPAKKKVLWAVVVETHDLQQENHLQVKYFGDSLGLFAANSEWSRIPLSCPGIVSFCQAFRTSASCQLETNHNITLSFKELPAACTQERCSTCQRSMHVLCQVMLVQNACTQALFDLLALCLQGSIQRTRLSSGVSSKSCSSQSVPNHLASQSQHAQI